MRLMQVFPEKMAAASRTIPATMTSTRCCTTSTKIDQFWKVTR